MNILLIYFKSFGGYKTNITRPVTCELLESLEKSRSTGEIRIFRKRLPVKRDRVIKKVERLLKKRHYDIVLIFGQTHDVNALEEEANNKWLSTNDIYGKTREKKYCTLDDKEEWAQKTGFNLNTTIGDFACSLAYYVALSVSKGSSQVGFFHVNRNITDDERNKLIEGIVYMIDKNVISTTQKRRSRRKNSKRSRRKNSKRSKKRRSVRKNLFYM